MTRIDYVLSGVANGHPVRIAGRGTTAPGWLDMVFTAAEPALAFDASWAALVGLDALAALTRGLVVAPDLPTFARGRVDLLTEGGAEIGTIVAHVAIHRRRGGYRCEAQFVEARIAVEPGERLTPVGERELHAVPMLGGVGLHSAAAVDTSRGRDWLVFATTFLAGCELGNREKLVQKLVLPAHGC